MNYDKTYKVLLRIILVIQVLSWALRGIVYISNPRYHWYEKNEEKYINFLIDADWIQNVLTQWYAVTPPWIIQQLYKLLDSA